MTTFKMSDGRDSRCWGKVGVPALSALVDQVSSAPDQFTLLNISRGPPRLAIPAVRRASTIEFRVSVCFKGRSDNYI